MIRRLGFLSIAVLVAVAVAACDGNPTAPAASTSEDLAVTTDLELQVVSDPEIAEALLDDVSLGMEMAVSGQAFRERRECFREARRLLMRGDRDAARLRARDCRLGLVQAMLERHGEVAIDELFGRVERLNERLGEASDEFARLADLQGRIQELLEEAYELRAEGDLAGAGERLMLALQMADRMRHRHPDFDADPPAVARLSMARAGEAIRLANRLIEEPTAGQERYLFRAGELRRRAAFSIEQGWYRRAVAQAHRSQQLSLLAVLDGERPTVEEAGRLLELADEVIARARAVIGDDPVEVQARLLAIAIRLRDRGAEAINQWQWRGVGLLWRSAITAAVLLPEADASR